MTAKWLHNLKVFLITGMLAIVPIQTLCAATTTDVEIKASLILTVIPYLKWHKQSPSTPKSPVICTIGQDSVYLFLEKKLRTEKITLKLSKRNAKSGFEGCHILYIGQTESERLGDIFKKTERQDIVTISSLLGFAKAGGMFEFKTTTKGIKIVINLKATENESIQIDSDLLGFADVIK